MDETERRAELVTAGAGRRSAEGLGAGVTEEVVAGEDVVDLEALGAGEALAHVALQERLVEHGGTPLAIREQGGSRVSSTGLAGIAGLHGEIRSIHLA